MFVNKGMSYGVHGALFAVEVMYPPVSGAVVQSKFSQGLWVLQVTLEVVVPSSEWSTWTVAHITRLIKSAVWIQVIKLDGELEVQFIAQSSFAYQTFMVPAGGELVNLSLHWVTSPVGVNGGGAVGGGDAFEVTQVDLRKCNIMGRC